jgi:hypothetical protein
MQKDKYSYKITDSGSEIIIFIRVKTESIRESSDIHDILTDCIYRISQYLP